jgi:signal transduction histidine kinase
MFRYFIALVFLCFCCLSYAQGNLTAQLREYHQLDSVIKVRRETDLKAVIEASKRMAEIGQLCQADSIIFKANHYHAEALSQLGTFDIALKISYENLAMAEQKNACPARSEFSMIIGSIYQSMGDWANAQTFMNKAKKYAITCGKYSDTIDINYEIGFNKVALGDEITGIEMVRQNLKAARDINNGSQILYGIDNLSNLLAELGDYEQSLAVELELLKMPEIWSEPLEKTVINEHLSEIYIKLKDWDNAQKYQREAFKHAQILRSNDWLYECYKLQAWIDEGRGDYKRALKNHQIYLALKDSVYQSNYGDKMAAMSSLYELDSKQKAIALLEKDKLIQGDQLKFQRVLLLVALLLGLVLFLLLRFFNQRKTEKMQVVFAQTLLKTQEQERQRISKELHDSVGQNILFIKNFLQRLIPGPDERLINSVNLALEEVRDIAKDLYPNQLEQYGLSAAVESLCELVQHSSGIFVSSDLQGIDDQLTREAKINCYRIIQECINNTIKHAEASAIRITSKLQDGKVEFVIQDNGKGFEKNTLEQKSIRSFGLLNIQERIKLLRGKFDLETTLQKGVKLTFAIPLRS